jgi:hypothetical protein
MHIMPQWTLPGRVYRKRPPTPPLPVYEQLFSDTLHSYDFDRNTWYPNIPKHSDSTTYPLRHQGHPSPLPPPIQAKFEEYEAVQFDLLKGKYIAQQEYAVNAKALMTFDTSRQRDQIDRIRLQGKEDALKKTIEEIDTKLQAHAKKHASMLDIINLQITMEKAYDYNRRVHAAYEEQLGSDTYQKPDPIDYLIVNTKLPFDANLISTPSPTSPTAPRVYKPPNRDDIKVDILPDMTSSVSFPSLGSSISPKTNAWVRR